MKTFFEEPDIQVIMLDGSDVICGSACSSMGEDASSELSEDPWLN